MEDLFNLVVFAILILVSTAFGGKRKKRPAQSGAPARALQERQRAERERAAAARERQPEPTPPDPGREPSTPGRIDRQPESIRDFFELLKEQATAATREPMPMVVEEEPPKRERVREVRGPARSIETLEPAGGRSHVRFHEKYIEPLAVPQVRLPPHFVLPRSPTALKRAVIWSEILGKPKGLD